MDEEMKNKLNNAIDEIQYRCKYTNCNYCVFKETLGCNGENLDAPYDWKFIE